MKNWNIGILGHVDSGKTSIAKVLSDIKSTAAFDSCKQSQERGITIDLGFSSFLLDNDNRVTLVDCPGHASLIKTIICGAQIIDAIILVIDVTKGIQLQTAECIMLAELYAPRFMVVMNKIDLVSTEKVESLILSLKTRFTKILEKANAEYIDFVRFSTVSNPEGYKNSMISRLFELLQACPDRICLERPLLMISDHCFIVKGKGSVLTGTIIQGNLHIGDSIQIISKGKSEVRKIKSIQIFKTNVQSASTVQDLFLHVIDALKGDRAAILVTDVNSENIERGIVCTPGGVQMTTKIAARVHRISYFKPEFPSNSKLHVSLLNCTELATVSFVSSESSEFLKSLPEDGCTAVIMFPKPVAYLPGIKILGSKLDMEPGANTCRFVFHGSVESAREHFDSFVVKERLASVDRVLSSLEIIGRDLVKKDCSLERFLGCGIQLIGKESNIVVSEGIISRPFGTSGKFRIDLKTSIPEDLRASEYHIRLVYNKTIRL